VNINIRNCCFFVLLFFSFHHVFSQTPVFYLNANNAIGTTTFTDSSPSNHAISVNGTPINDVNCNDTAVYINGVTWTPSGHYLLAAESPDFDLGSNDFTIHFWIYLDNLTSTHAAFDFRQLAAEHIFFVHYPGSGWLFSDRQGAGTLVQETTPSMQAQKWTHVALVRSGNSFSIYINGCAVANNSVAAPVSESAALAIGFSWDNRDQLNGYIDEFYVYNGTALWNNNFIPPGQSIFSSCIPQISSIAYTVSTTNLNCVGDSTGTITITPTSGTPPFNYQWSGYASNQTGATVTGLPAGTYNVIITDQSCNVGYDTITISPTNPPLNLTVSASDSLICKNTTANLISSVNGGAQPYTYSWNNGNNSSTQTVGPTSTNTYVLTVADSNNCITKDSIEIKVEELSVQHTVTENCQVDSVHFLSNVSSNYTTINSYLWLFGDGGTSTLTNPNHLYTVSGQYNTLLIAGSVNGCTDSSSANLMVHPNPIANFTASNVCDNSAVLFVDSSIVNGPDSISTWQWNFGDGSPIYLQEMVNNGYVYNTPGTYNVKLFVSSNFGCSDSIVKPITIHPNPVGNFGSFNLCQGFSTPFNDSTTIALGNITNWEWDFDDNTPISTQQSPNHLYNSCGTYAPTLIVTSNNGCKDTITKPTTIYCLPIINTGIDDTICFGESTIITASPNNLSYSYAWSYIGNNNFSSLYNPTVSPTITTTYTVVVTDTNSCSTTDSVTIFANTGILIQLSPTNVSCFSACDGQISTSIVGGNAPYTYNWSNNTNQSVNENLCPDTYSLTVTDAWGCSSVSDTLISEPIELLAFVNSFAPATCSDSCNGTATITVLGGTIGNGYNYSWNSTPVQNTASAVALCSGSYICTVTDNNNCIAKDTVVITAPSPITLITIINPTACDSASGEASTTAYGGTGTYTYNWQPTGQSAAFIDSLSAGSYTINVTDDNGCSHQETIVITTTNQPNANVTASDNIIFSGNTTTLNASSAVDYTWSPTTGLSCDTCQNTIATPVETTNYCVTITDENGCKDTACIIIEVDYMCDLVVPNAFSPNNDGKNDFLVLHGWDKCVSSDFSMRIFNRWGEKVFESNSPTEVWDGKNTNALTENDSNGSAVFVYYINAKLITGETIERKGNISLIK
ncbi:MAG: PKD domain-containing protein, partial [Bacteroidia bacterium]